MQDKLLELQKQIIEFDKLSKQEIEKLKMSLNKMSEIFNQINNK